jgi:hypothetical protein
MKKFSTFARSLAATVAVTFICALPAHAELQARDIGNTGSANAFYDTTLNLTWLNVQSAASTWDVAKNWAESLNMGGVTGWRLPTMGSPLAEANWSYGGTNEGYNVATSSSEIASLFFSTLSNKSLRDTNGNIQSGSGLINNGSFQQLQSTYYWLGTQSATDNTKAWYFDAGVGFQSEKNVGSGFLHGLAVHSGDVGAIVASVPEPETYAMMLAGLGLIGGIARRRRQKVESA